MTIQTFVTIHDKALIDECEADGRFAGLDYTYLFVGPRWITGTIDTRGAPLIICRDYADNIERWPQFYDFTGWWTLAHHRLINAERVMLVQYDMRPAVPADDVDLALDAHEFVAFTAGHRSAHNWMLLLEGFEHAFACGLADNDARMPPPDFEEWPSTQGTAWRTESFYAFMDWVRPMLDCWAPNLWAGHLAERSVKAWLHNTGRTEGYLPGAVVHDHLDCHGTCALMAGQTDVHAARAAAFGVG